jgi:flagellar motor switch protein FliG
MPEVESKQGQEGEITKLNKFQKLAVLFVIIGPDSAAQVLKSFDPHEVEVICSEMGKFNMISVELQNAILKEFSGVAIEASTSIRGGLDLAKSVLEKTLGLFKASEIISRVAPARTHVAAMQGIVDMDARQIYNLIRHEQPQTVALVLSYVGPEKAAEALGFFHPESRDKILERIATLAPTPIEVVEKVVDVLVAKRGVNQTRALNQTGGVKIVAEMLNSMDKQQGKSLLVAIEEHNPELGAAIRQKMFTFEDLANLENTIIQRILREVDLRDLAIALKTASEKLKGVLLSCITKRAAETVQEEISFMGPLRLRDIEGAQVRIIEVVRRLEGEGAIDIGDNNKKEGQFEMV